MSLLLDALNRASLDKAALASAVWAQAGKQASLTEQNEQSEQSVHHEPAPLGVAADTPAAADQPSLATEAPATWPSLQLSSLKAVPDATLAQSLTAASVVSPESTMFEPPDAQVALSLTPKLQEPPQRPLPELVKLTRTRAIPDLAPLAVPQTLTTTTIATPAVALGDSVLPSPAMAEASVTRPLPASVNPANPVNGSRVAQNILRAKQPPTAKSRTRLVVLASVAVALVLATAIGGVFLGALGDPMVLAQNLGLAAPAPLAPSPVTPPLLASTAESAVTTELASVATAAPAASAAAIVVDSPSANPTPRMPVATAPRKAVVAGTLGPALARARPAAVVPVSSPACPAGTLPPDCRPVEAPRDSGQTAQGSVQSRHSGPSVLEQGYSALTQGRLQEAQTIYANALRTNPEERDALLGLAYIAQKQQRSDDAQAYYRRVLRQDPGNAVASTGLLALNALSDPQDFGSQSRLLAEQNPASAAAQSILGHALVRQDRLADAQLAFARALQLEPGVARHAYNLAVALDRLHDYEAARQYYERALTLLAQSGGERASGFAPAEVQMRLSQLPAAQ